MNIYEVYQRIGLGDSIVAHVVWGFFTDPEEAVEVAGDIGLTLGYVDDPEEILERITKGIDEVVVKDGVSADTVLVPDLTRYPIFTSVVEIFTHSIRDDGSGEIWAVRYPGEMVEIYPFSLSAEKLYEDALESRGSPMADMGYFSYFVDGAQKGIITNDIIIQVDVGLDEPANIAIGPRKLDEAAPTVRPTMLIQKWPDLCSQAIGWATGMALE